MRKKQSNKVNDSEKLIQLITETLEENKAENIFLLDLKGKSDAADYMIIATGRSDRHVGSIGDNLSRALKSEGFANEVEGMEKKDWVLIDAYSVIVHVFRKEIRELFNLEKLWTA